MRKVVGSIVVVAILFVMGAMIVTAQDESSSLSRITPVIIDFQQDVPILADIIVPLENGESITATVPMTIGIALKIDISSSLEAVVTLEDTETEPTVTVVEPTPTPRPVAAVVGGDDVLVSDVRWKVVSVEDLGDTIESGNQFLDDVTTTGRFIQVEFEVENLGSDQRTFMGVELADDQGRSYTASSDLFMYLDDSKLCILENLNPNVTRVCQAVYEVAGDAEGLQIKFTDLDLFGGAEELVDLGLN